MKIEDDIIKTIEDESPNSTKKWAAEFRRGRYLEHGGL